MGAVFIYDSVSDTAAISGGSFVSSLPLTNVQTRDIRQVARTTSADASATQFQVAFGKDRPIGGIAIGPMNLSPGGSYRVQAYGGEPETLRYDSGVKTRPGNRVPMYTYPWGHPALWSGIDADEIDTGDVSFADLLPVGTFASRVVVQIDDEDNPRGYLDIGRVLIGRTYRPAINYGYGSNAFTIEPLTDTEQSLGGTEFYWRRGQRRIFRCVFEFAEEAELFGDVYRMMETLGLDGQLFLIPDPDDDEHFQKRSFLATFRQIPAIEQAVYRRGTVAFDLKEVL